MDNPTNVGVIGLGPSWRRRYRRAVLALKDQLRVAAVCDPIRHRAVQEARRLGCAVAAGPTDLMERPSIDAVLLLEPLWFGLWPLELACRQGKPVFCGPALETDDVHADAVVRQVRQSGLSVQMANALLTAAVTERLRELLRTELGPVRFLSCESIRPGLRSALPDGPVPAPFLGRRGSDLLAWCVDLAGPAPASVLASDLPAAGFASVQIECQGGVLIGISCGSAPLPACGLRLQVACERGRAWVEMPGSICWKTAAGKQSQHLRRHGSVEAEMLERFVRALREGENPRPDLEAAHRALDWLRLAGRSRVEGRRVFVNEP